PSRRPVTSSSRDASSRAAIPSRSCTRAGWSSRPPTGRPDQTRPRMVLLAIDCAAGLCAAALYDTEQDRVLASVSHDIGKGHAEALTDVVETALQDAGKTYGDLGLIAVTVG